MNARAFAALVLLWCAPAPAQEQAPVKATRHMVAAAHPLAAAAGREILRAGGSAVDAAIATQMVLNLVEPQSSGIGGGAFLVHYAAASGEIATYDGRETAPAAAAADRFLDAAGKPLPFMTAAVGGRSVGVPGVMRMLELAHRDHGRLPWARLFEPAIALAVEGFAVSPRLRQLLAADARLHEFEPAKSHFYRADGSALGVGDKLVNPAFAATLLALAAGGADAFYQGGIARAIVAAVRGSAVAPGDLTEADLANYRAARRAPVCALYRVWRLCGMGPPSSGGVAVLQMLGLLSRFELAAHAPLSPMAAHLFAEAGRLAFADRNRYVADSDFVNVPVKGLLDPGYLASRSRLIDPGRSQGQADPGDPPWRDTRLLGEDATFEIAGTSHLSILAENGDAVAMTTTIEGAFGSRLMAGGFLLNNQLTDFSFIPVADGRPVANAIAPGKRPRSSMSPMLGFDGEGRLMLVAGSPGGSGIINYVARTLVAILDWGMDPQAAVALPHYGSRNGPTELEAGTGAVALGPALAALGHKLTVQEQASGLHVILRRGAVIEGGADPRREGLALGD